MITKLFVGNLCHKVTGYDLQDALAVHGLIGEVHLVTNATGRSRGFAFVTLPTAGEAEAAIRAIDGRKMNGRSLTVNPALTREQRQLRK